MALLFPEIYSPFEKSTDITFLIELDAVNYHYRVTGVVQNGWDELKTILA